LVHIFKDKFGDGHLPPFDLDNDTFGDISTLRGYHWRGADCNELNKNFYPGRKTGEKILDQDCNGIFGVNAKGSTYEDEFCSHSKRFGVAVIGDSAGAHFSIPEKYFNASMINGTTYHDLLQRAADELDIPNESGYTGNTPTHGHTRHSFYKYAR
jgi:acyloxyacyl hydrolase